jgi:hypothetical protein
MPENTTTSERNPTSPAGALADGTGAATTADPSLKRLYQMSRTAGVGLADYRSVNTFSVIAMLTGVASFLVVAFPTWPLLLLVPLVAVLLGVVSLAQVRSSNQTQTGSLIALAGIVAALGFAGYWAQNRLSLNAADRQARIEIAALITSLGESIRAEDYAKAYALFEPRFRQRVDQATFESTLRIVRSRAYRVEIAGMGVTERTIIERDRSGNMTAVAAADILAAESDGSTRRVSSEVLELAHDPTGWYIRGVQGWFPPASQAR